MDILGVRTHVFRCGEGPPLLLVHGVGGPQTWQKVIQPLSRHFLVVVPHLPGFGKSDCPGRNLSTDDYCEAIREVVDELDISTITIAGTSYGGQIAATFSYRYPDRLERLILIASTGLSGERWFARSDVGWIFFSTFIKWTVLRNRRLLDVTGRSSFYDLSNRPDDLVSDFYTAISGTGKRNSWLRALKNASTPSVEFTRQLTQLRVATLILWGENDHTLHTRDALEFQRLIPRASLKVFSECAHSVPLEKPEEVCDAIIKFSMQPNVMLP